MKEQKWEDTSEAVKEFFDAGGVVSDEESDIDENAVTCNGKTHVTELRRRIEERMESKRIALEYGYDEFDDLNDALQ